MFERIALAALMCFLVGFILSAHAATLIDARNVAAGGMVVGHTLYRITPAEARP